MSNRAHISKLAIILLAGILLPTIMSTTNSWSINSAPEFPTGSGSWNPRVPCSSPWIVRIADITDNMTGSASQTSSIFNPGITSPVGTAKRWLSPGSTPPGWVSPGPACTIVNSHGTVALFVELDGVKRVGIVNEDCTGTYDVVNGGTSNGGSFCDSTFNIYDPAVVSNYGTSCTSATDPTCFGRIHAEIDHDWKAAHYCGPSTTCDDAALGSQTTTSSLIDFQGFIYWDPGNLNQQWHNFNGWEIHSVTAWRLHQTNPALSSSFTFSPSAPITGTQVSFIASASGGTQPYFFTWSFGDGSTGTGSSTTHTFTVAGSYNVVLTVKDSSSPQQTATTQQTVNVSNPPPPLATNYTFSPSSPSVGQTITFTGSASGGISPYTFKWNFGDGVTGSGNPASHSFSSSGSFTVQLSVTDSSGTTASTTQTVTVNPAPLSTSFSFSPASPTTGQTINFLGSATGGVSPYSFDWLFGDGASSTGNSVSHSYVTSGNFTVRLLATDSAGANATASHTIAVTQPAPPDFTVTSNPSTVQISVGGSGSSTITLTSTGGFAGTINLSASVSPSGPGVSLSPTSVTLVAGGSSTATLTVTTQLTTPLGNYTVIVTGNSTSMSHSTSVLVVIRLAPDFSLAASASSITVPRTTAGTVTLSLSSLNGFNGTVTVSVTVTLSGPKASLASSSVRLAPGGTTSDILTIKALKKTPVGIYTVTVTATSGIITHSATITVNVT